MSGQPSVSLYLFQVSERVGHESNLSGYPSPSKSLDIGIVDSAANTSGHPSVSR